MRRSRLGTVETRTYEGKIVFAKKPGDAVRVGLVGPQGRRKTVTLTLGVRPLST